MTTEKDLHKQYNRNLRHFVQEARELLEPDDGPADHSAIFRELQVLDNRYSDKNEINRGGMKRILKTRDKATGRDLAMAVLPDSANADEVEAFLREARITSQLQHPNIMPVYDIGVNEDDRPFFTMKLIEGENLADILVKLNEGNDDYQQRYPLATLIDIFHKLCEAVAYAHSKGIIHLDLKPANVQVSDFGEVILCDWGLARVLDEACEDLDVERYSINIFDLKNRSCSGFIKGSPGYLAPEQADETGPRKDKRTDIYSLGAILYSILTYHKVIETDSIVEYLGHCLKGHIRLPSERAPDLIIPKGLEAVCMKALSVSPGDRYQSAGDLLTDIQSYLGGYATDAEDADFLTQFKLLVVRNKELCLMFTIAFLVIMIISALFVRGLARKEQIATQAHLETEKALTELKAEQERSSKLSKESAIRYLERARKHYDNFDHTSAHDAITTALALNPDLPDGKRVLADITFTLGDISAAAMLYREIGGNLPLYLSPGKAYINDIHAEKEATPDKLKSFLDMLRECRPPEMYEHVVYEQIHRLTDSKQQLALVNDVLRKDNPRLHDYELDYDAASQTLILRNAFALENAQALRALECKIIDLSRTGLARIDFLKQMRPTSINVSATRIQSVDVVNDMELDSLDISWTRVGTLGKPDTWKVRSLNITGTPIRELQGFEKNPFLESIIIAPRQFPPHIMDTLQLEITVKQSFAPPPRLTPIDNRPAPPRRDR